MHARVALVAFAACVAAHPAMAEQVSVVERDGQRVVISVPVDVVGADAALLMRWQRDIDRAWNRGNDGRPFTTCGVEVVIKPRLTVTAEPTPSKTSHLVVVRNVRPGEPYVSSVWHALGTSPSYSPRTGYWGSNMNADTVAHEFGHLLGLLDEYVEGDLNANGLREPGERPVPDTRRHPDAWVSLMANEHGAVLNRHIREILRMHGADESCAK